MKKLAMKVSLINTIFMFLLCGVSSAIWAGKPMQIGVLVLSNLSINIIRITTLLIAAIFLVLLLLKLKNRLTHNMAITSSIIIVLVIFCGIVGVNRQNKIDVEVISLEARPVIIRVFDFSQW